MKIENEAWKKIADDIEKCKVRNITIVAVRPDEPKSTMVKNETAGSEPFFDLLRLSED